MHLQNSEGRVTESLRVSESLGPCQLVRQGCDQFSTTYHSPTKSVVLHHEYSLGSLLSTLPFIHPISSPVSQLIGASTDMMHDYERHASLVLSWRLSVSVNYPNPANGISQRVRG
jgi:hypothetical protein